MMWWIILGIAGFALFLFWVAGPPQITVKYLDVIGGIAAIFVMFKVNWIAGLCVGAVFLIHAIVVTVKTKCPRCKENFCFSEAGKELVHEGNVFQEREKRGNNEYVWVNYQNNIYDVTYRCKKCGYETTRRETRKERC